MCIWEKESTILEFIPSVDEQILAAAWLYIRVPETQPPIDSPKLWGSSFRKLVSCPSPNPFTTTIRDERAYFLQILHLMEGWKITIQRLQHGWSSDHTGLEEEQFVHAVSRVAPNPQKLTHEMFDTLKQITTTEHTKVQWYLQVMNWLNTMHLLSFQSCIPLQNNERNKVLQQNLWQLYIRKTWLT